MKSVQRILILLLLGISSLAKGQVLISLVLGDDLNTGKIEFGLDGGLTLSNQSGLTQSDMLPSFNLGFYFDIKLKNAWMLHTGVIVKSDMGAGNIPVYWLGQPDLDNAFVGGTVERELSYFNVPILLKYNFPNHFFVEAGPQLGLLYKANDEFSNQVQGNDLTYSRDIREDYHPLDGGFLAGIGYRLMKGNGMNLGVRYYYGLVDVVIDDSGSDIKNNVIYATLGIPIGVGKAKEKAKAKAEEQK